MTTKQASEVNAKLSPFITTLVGTFINMVLLEVEGAKILNGTVQIVEVLPTGTTIKINVGKKTSYKMSVGKWVATKKPKK